jgi:hypothetical protein
MGVPYWLPIQNNQSLEYRKPREPQLLRRRRIRPHTARVQLFEVTLLLWTVAVVLMQVARHLRVPYPALLALVGGWIKIGAWRCAEPALM